MSYNVKVAILQKILFLDRKVITNESWIFTDQ